MLTRRSTLLAALTVPAVAACSPASTTPSAPVTAVPANGAEVNAATFAGAIALPGVVILDVRTPQEYKESRLDKAMNIDVSAPDFAAKLAPLDRNASYAVYCRSGNRSATALLLMKQAGFTSAFHLGGGIGAWTAAGLPVVKG